VGSRDLLPLLRQIVSGELDADRMDYLQRDSFFTGVNYGKFDLDWIVQNLETVERGGRVHLALQHRAVFAFEDFLLSRYHMFLSVYFHYASVGYEQLLQRYCDTSGGEYELPADVDRYLEHDDVTLTAALRASKNPWAMRIVRRQGYRLLLERGPFLDPRGAPDLEEGLSLLASSGIDGFITLSRFSTNPAIASRTGCEALVARLSPLSGRNASRNTIEPIASRICSATPEITAPP